MRGKRPLLEGKGVLSHGSWTETTPLTAICSAAARPTPDGKSGPWLWPASESSARDSDPRESTAKEGISERRVGVGGGDGGWRMGVRGGEEPDPRETPGSPWPHTRGPGHRH